MSAETIPSEVVGPRSKGVTCVGCPALREKWWEEYLDNDERDSGTNYKCGAADDRLIAGPYGHPSVTTPDWCPALADRSTRPAEPAAPVAGAGEVVAWGVEMYGFWELCNDEETARYRHEPARKVEPLVRLSTLEAERARADRLERERDWQYEENVARIAAQGAAEQRAADALARAEKAEGALEATREDGWRSIAPEDCEVATVQTFGTITLRNSHPAWVRDDDGRTYEAVWTLDDRGRAYWWDIEAESPVDPVAIYPHPLAARASREAQPATDGGDNG